MTVSLARLGIGAVPVLYHIRPPTPQATSAVPARAPRGGRARKVIGGPFDSFAKCDAAGHRLPYQYYVSGWHCDSE